MVVYAYKPPLPPNSVKVPIQPSTSSFTRLQVNRLFSLPANFCYPTHSLHTPFHDSAFLSSTDTMVFVNPSLAAALLGTVSTLAISASGAAVPYPQYSPRADVRDIGRSREEIKGPMTVKVDPYEGHSKKGFQSAGRYGSQRRSSKLRARQALRRYVLFAFPRRRNAS